MHWIVLQSPCDYINSSRFQVRVTVMVHVFLEQEAHTYLPLSTQYSRNILCYILAKKWKKPFACKYYPVADGQCVHWSLPICVVRG